MEQNSDKLKWLHEIIMQKNYSDFVDCWIRNLFYTGKLFQMFASVRKT